MPEPIMVKIDYNLHAAQPCDGCGTSAETVGATIDVTTLTESKSERLTICLSCASELQYKVEQYLRGARNVS